MKALIALIQPAFDWTWKNSLQVALLVGLVLLVQKVLGRWLTPRLRYALSLLILLRLLLPAVVPSPLSLQNLFPPTTRPAIVQAVSFAVPEPAGPITPRVAEPAAVAPDTGLPVTAPFVSTPVRRPSTLSVAEVLALAWACGLVALVSLAGWRYGQWCRLIRQGRRLSDTRLRALLDGARQAMGVRRPVTLVALARLGSPAVFGFRQVRLLLPESALEQLTDQDLRLLFLHEMAHVRRQDMMLNVLLMAVQFVHWFNPLVWLGLHRLRADRELVCDAMVLERTRPEERSDYGGLLIKLVDDFPAAQRMIPSAVPVLSSKREIKRRIVLIKHHRSAGLAASVATGLAAVALACAAFTNSSQQPPAGEPGPPPTPTVGDVGVRPFTNLSNLSLERPTKSADGTQISPSSSSPARKIELVEPWKDVTIKLVKPGSSKGPGSKSRTVEVKAKRAVYKGTGGAKIGLIPSGEFSILCIHDPYTKRICFIDGEHTFYVPDPAGMKGYSVGPGAIVFSHSYLEVPDTPGQEADAMSRFENTFDVAKFRNEWEQRDTVQRVDFLHSPAVPRFYFSDQPIGGGRLMGAEVIAVDLTDDILRVDLRNHWHTPVPASIWIDLKSRSVIKSVVDGQEMDLKGEQPRYMLPPKKPDPASLKQQREAEDHYQSGMALWRQNLTNQAIRELQKALILRPDHAETRKSLAAVLDAITRSPPPPGGGTNNP